MIVIDGHQDIAYNIQIWKRDYSLSAHAIRQAESEANLIRLRGQATLGLEDWLAGNVAVVFGTLFTEPARPTSLSEGHGQPFHTPQEAHQLAMWQLDTYHRMADENRWFRLIKTARDLDEVLVTWQQPRDAAKPDPRQIGVVVLMEGADPIVEPEQVELWYERGLRIVGLAWAATRYAGGNHEPGPLTDLGRRLLRVMRQFNMGLDLSHCAEQAYFQALDAYDGPVIASHANPRKCVNQARNLSDEMIRRLIERDGIVGVMPVNVMLKPGWRRGDPKEQVALADVVGAIDHVCQLAGNARHAGIGTDFDGGFGAQDIPAELDTIADVGKIGDELAKRGYAQADVEAIMSGNWLRFLGKVLP